MKRVIFHSEALAEFDAAIQFYEERSQGLGLDLHALVEKATQELRDHPTRHGFLRDTGFRAVRLKRFPHLVVYLDLPDAIWIAAIVHERRHPDYWRTRQIDDDRLPS